MISQKSAEVYELRLAHSTARLSSFKDIYGSGHFEANKHLIEQHILDTNAGKQLPYAATHV
jgi:hypothetical protein